MMDALAIAAVDDLAHRLGLEQSPLDELAPDARKQALAAIAARVKVLTEVARKVALDRGRASYPTTRNAAQCAVSWVERTARAEIAYRLPNVDAGERDMALAWVIDRVARDAEAARCASRPSS